MPQLKPFNPNPPPASNPKPFGTTPSASLWRLKHSLRVKTQTPEPEYGPEVRIGPRKYSARQPVS